MLVFLYCHRDKDTHRHLVCTVALVEDPMDTIRPLAFRRYPDQKEVERTSLFEESLGTRCTERTPSLVKDRRYLRRKGWLDLAGCRQATHSGVVAALWPREGCSRRPR